MLKDEGERLTRVVICSPSDAYFGVSDCEAHNFNETADPQRTRAQFARLVSILESAGCDVVDRPELEGHPNSVFTRDASLCTPGGFIKLRMGLESRRGEEEWMARILASLDEPLAGEIRDPGTAEGGDVILAGDVAFVGRSKRTNDEGIEQIAALLAGMNYEVRTVPVPDGYLHLGGVMSAIGPRKLVCCSTQVPGEVLEGFEVADVPFRGPSSGNVICLAPNEVVANAAENGETIAVLESRGVAVHAIDLSEFRKGAGGPTCLILPVERRRDGGQ
jgi:dimethylargininase